MSSQTPPPNPTPESAPEASPTPAPPSPVASTGTAEAAGAPAAPPSSGNPTEEPPHTFLQKALLSIGKLEHFTVEEVEHLYELIKKDV